MSSSLRTPPGLPQSSLWTSWRCPGLSQEGPGAAEDHMKFTKLTCSKPGKYVYLTLWDLKKYVSSHFFTLQGPTRDPPESSPFPSRSPLGTQKGSPGRPGTTDGPPGAPFGPLFNISSFSFSNRTPITKTSIFISSGATLGKSSLFKVDDFQSPTDHQIDLGPHFFFKRHL